jgi:superfamily I DNA and/or RNA helicase/predicted RNA-binding protein with RPS1 domain
MQYSGMRNGQSDIIRIQEKWPVGYVLDAKVERKIDPGMIVVFFEEKVNATLSILDMSWNLAHAELIYNKYKPGDDIRVVVLDYSEEFNHIRLGIKHLSKKPFETENWKELEFGSKVSGSKVDFLPNVDIIKLNNGLTGISYDKSYRGNNYQIINKDFKTNLVVLRGDNGQDEVKVEQPQPGKKQSSFDLLDNSLFSYDHFSNSLLGNFAKDDDKEIIKNGFHIDPNIFAKDISFDVPFTLYFEFGRPAWDNFQYQIVPALLNVDNTDGAYTQQGIKALKSEKYWINYDSQRNNFNLYNHNINFHGGISFPEDDICQFIVYTVSYGQTNSRATNGKKYGAKKGSFLLGSKLQINSPNQPTGLGEEKKLVDVYKHLQAKQMCFEIVDRLRKETGELMRSEGEALRIFDKFLEFQEDLARKVGSEDVFRLNRVDRTHYPGAIGWKLPPEVEDYLGIDEGDIQLDVKERVESTKDNITYEYKKVGNARAKLRDNDWILITEDKDDLDINSGLYLQKKISVRQFQIQREIIQDFFDKKLRLDHIENLLMRPDRITPPRLPIVNFYNENLKFTEKKQSDNNQILAVKKAVGNDNILLIQGPPGTGKTTVIAEVVKQLTDNGEKILVTSQTHVAVDNVLEKLAKEESLSFLRIGNLNRVLDSVKHFHPSLQIKNYVKDFTLFLEVQERIINDFNKEKEVDEIKEVVRSSSLKYSPNIREKLQGFNFRLINLLTKNEFTNSEILISSINKWSEDVESGMDELITPLLYQGANVVFATCIGVKADKEFSESDLKFDTVIIDEAGKANLAESLVAISLAKKVILVGDQMQLPPYMEENLLDPKESGSFPNTKFGKDFLSDDINHALKISFFEFLEKRIAAEEFPRTNLEMLNYQHRMHPHIGEFVSSSFYGGKVNMGGMTHLNHLPMAKPFDKEITFINTNSFDNPYEETDGFSAKNPTEAQIITQSVLPKMLEGDNVDPGDIAIIAPYKSQVSLIKKVIEKSGNSMLEKIEVSTLDSFQGMEFDIIIFSFTRSASPEQEKKKVGFLDDARRLNVAFSRAKKKLILVGNASTLTQRSSHYDRIFNYTRLFQNLVKLSKNPKVGRFVDITDFKEFKNSFQKFQIKNPIGSTVIGKIKRIENYGLFVNVEGRDGLVHISNVAYDFINSLHKLYNEGEEIKMKIIGYEDAGEKIELGIKQLSEPISYRKLKKDKKNTLKKSSLESWKFLKKRYPIGENFEFTISNVVNFGIFIKMTNDYSGLIPMAHLNPEYRPDLQRNYKKGEKITAQVMKYDDKKKKISLSESLVLLSNKNRKW